LDRLDVTRANHLPLNARLNHPLTDNLALHYRGDHSLLNDLLLNDRLDVGLLHHLPLDERLNVLVLRHNNLLHQRRGVDGLNLLHLLAAGTASERRSGEREHDGDNRANDAKGTG
jgi:hypothetical protein